MPRNFEAQAMQAFGTTSNWMHIKGGDFDSDEWERLSDSESQRNIIDKSNVYTGPKDIKVMTQVTLSSDDHFGIVNKDKAWYRNPAVVH